MMKFGLEEDFNKTDLEERVEILFQYLVKWKRQIHHLELL